MNKFEIMTAAIPDREETVAEIFHEGALWAEISEEVIGNYIIEFYNHPQKERWEFSFNEAIKALNLAKKALVDLGPRLDSPNNLE